MLEEWLRRIIREEMRAALREEAHPALRGVVDAPLAELLTLREAAAIAKKSERTISEWMRKGRLHRYGAPDGHPRVSRRELLDLLFGALVSERDEGETHVAELLERAKR